MSIEWSRLRVLDAVARTGSVTAAAALLRMTGPAVSQQLRRIEAEAGARVVVPDGRGVRLTSEGRILAEYAAQVSGLMQQAENDLHRDEEPVGRVCVSALASIIRGPLARELPGFQRRHPRIEIRVEDGETPDDLERLAAGHLDIVFAESWNPAPPHLPAGLRAHRFARQQAWIALPAEHPLRGRGRLGIDDLADEIWASCARDSNGYESLVQVARRRGIELDIRHFVDDHATQLALVAAGLAVACVPVSGDPPETPGVVFLRLTPAMHRDILLLTAGRTLPRAVEALCRHLLEE